MALASVEYRFPIKTELHLKFFGNLIGLDAVKGVVFYDSGQSWYSSFEKAHWKQDAGLGLRMQMNVGSMFEKVIFRLDVAKPINDAAVDDTKVWFGVNQAF